MRPEHLVFRQVAVSVGEDDLAEGLEAHHFQLSDRS
jgi:hypothetical protein